MVTNMATIFRDVLQRSCDNNGLADVTGASTKMVRSFLLYIESEMDRRSKEGVDGLIGVSIVKLHALEAEICHKFSTKGSAIAFATRTLEVVEWHAWHWTVVHRCYADDLYDVHHPADRTVVALPCNR